MNNNIIKKYYLPYNYKELEEIKIPEGVEELGGGTFSNCLNLKRIVLPKSIRKISNYAFDDCKSLEEIEIPEKVEEIGSGCFNGCINLKRIVLPKSIRKISNYVFKNCEALEEIEIPEGVEKLRENSFYGCTKLKRIVLPQSLMEISGNAFENCKSLEEIEIPEKVEEIGSNCFKGCINLKRIVLPKRLKEIYNSAFEDCKSLEEIKILEGVEELGDRTFSNCRSLKEIKIPEGVEKLGENIFYDCTKLKRIVLPKRLKEIYNSAFENCIALEEVEIPEKVEDIGYNCFDGCINLKRIVLSKNLKIIKSSAFKHCIALEEIEIPEGVEEIGEAAFSTCTNLKRVILPQSLKKIGPSAFKNCESLEEIEIPKGVEEIGKFAFTDCKNLKKIVLSKKIDFSVFGFCKKLEEIETLEGVEEFGDRTFEYCPNIKRLVLSTSLNNIDKNIFNICRSLKSIKIKFKSFEQLEKFINNNKEELKHFINRLSFKKEQLVFVGNELPLYQKLLIAIELGLDNYSFEKDNNIKKKKQRIRTFTSNPEIDDKINKIYVLISLLSNNTQIVIKRQVEKLIKDYQNLEKEYTPVFRKTEPEIKLVFGDKKTIIISSLDNIIFKLQEIESFNELLKRFEQYKTLIDNNITLEKSDYISDTINEIILLINDFDEEQKQDIKKQLKIIIDDSQKDLNKKIDTLFDNNPFVSLNNQSIIDNLSLNISKFKDNIENIHHKIVPVKELLQKLKKQKNEYITDISDITDTIYSIRAIIDKLPDDEFKEQIKKELEDTVKKSIDYINTILSNQQYEKANYQEIISVITPKIMIILVKISEYNRKSKSQIILDIANNQRNEIQSINNLINKLIKIKEVIKGNIYLTKNIDVYSGVEQLFLNIYFKIINSTIMEDEIKKEAKNELLRIVEDKINILNSIEDNPDNYYQQLKEIIRKLNGIELTIVQYEEDMKKYETFTKTGKKAIL